MRNKPDNRHPEISSEALEIICLVLQKLNPHVRFCGEIFYLAGGSACDKNAPSVTTPTTRENRKKRMRVGIAQWLGFIPSA